MLPLLPALAFFQRARLKLAVRDPAGAINDFSAAIDAQELGPARLSFALFKRCFSRVRAAGVR
jgi:hypothetical protein